MDRACEAHYELLSYLIKERTNKRLLQYSANHTMQAGLVHCRISELQ